MPTPQGSLCHIQAASKEKKTTTATHLFSFDQTFQAALQSEIVEL